MSDFDDVPTVPEKPLPSNWLARVLATDCLTLAKGDRQFAAWLLRVDRLCRRWYGVSVTVLGSEVTAAASGAYHEGVAPHDFAELLAEPVRLIYPNG